MDDVQNFTYLKLLWGIGQAMFFTSANHLHLLNQEYCFQATAGWFLPCVLEQKLA